MGERTRCSFNSLTLNAAKSVPNEMGCFWWGANGERSNTCQRVIGTSSMCVSGRLSAQRETALERDAGEATRGEQRKAKKKE